MKKVILGFVALGAFAGLLATARRMSGAMREHMEQMAAHCKQMAAQSERRGEPVGTR